MKRKEIEKVPFRAAEPADKKFTYIAKSFVENIKDEEHLLVEIYKNQKKAAFDSLFKNGFYKERLGNVLPGRRCLVKARN